MTIGVALSGLDNLLKADDIPCYYKPSIKAIMDTITLSKLQESFINKPCISEKVCEHDKQMVLDKIRAEIESAFEDLDGYDSDELTTFVCRIENIFNKYKAESEEQ